MDGTILNADINAAAAIAYSKLNLAGSVANADLAGSIADGKLSAITTAGKVDGSAVTNLANVPAGAGALPAANLPAGIDAASIADGSVSSAEFQYLGTVTSDVQAQLDGKLAPGGDGSSLLNVSSVGVNAVWDESQIVDGAITNADLAGSIAYGKLSLTGAILNADLAGSIDASKITNTAAVLTANTFTDTQNITANGEAVYSLSTSSGIKINAGNLEVAGSSSTLAGNAIIVSLGGIPMMMQSGSGTLSGGTESPLFSAAFAAGSTPIVVLTDTTGTNAMAVTAADNTGFTATGTTTDTYNWIAIGPAPYAP